MARTLSLVILAGLALRLSGKPATELSTSAGGPLLADGSDEVEYEQGGASGLELTVRAVTLGVLFTPCTALALPAYLSSTVRRRIWYPLLSYTLAQGGPAFIKWGQWAATRPDMFPESLCYALEALQSNAPSHSYAFSKRQVEAALGAPIDEVFVSFEMRPVASGSIAQVHRAVLRPGGKGLGGDAVTRLGGGGENGDSQGLDVAVKVRHPGVAKRMRIDFALMKVLGQTIDSLSGLKGTQLGASLEQFGHTLGGQTRLDVEGTHLADFNRNFNTWRPSVGFPKAIIKTPTVLVESWEPGVLISDYLERHKISQAADHAVLASEAAAANRYDVEVPANLTTRSDFGSTSTSWLWSGTWSGMYQKPAEKKLSRKDQELEALLRHPSVAHFILQRGEDIYLKMLLRDNLMHADLHPGNILISTSETRGEAQQSSASDPNVEAERAGAPDANVAGGPDTVVRSRPVPGRNKEDANAGRFGLRTSLILVDAGMVAELNRLEQDNFIGLLSALGDGDGFRAAVSLLRMSSSGQEGCSTLEQQRAFAVDTMKYFEEHCGGYGTGVDVGEVLRGVLGLLRTHNVRIDTNYATLTMNVLCIESLAKKLEPKYNVLDGARVLLRSYSTLCLAEGHSGVRRIENAAKRLERIGPIQGDSTNRGPIRQVSVALGRAIFTLAFPIAQKARQYFDDRLFERMRRDRVFRSHVVSAM